MSKITRSNALARGGQAVAAAAVLTALPSIAGAKEDAKLLSRVEAFWAVHKETEDRFEKSTAEKHRVKALPECPPYVFPAENREAFERYEAFMDEHGAHALWVAYNSANERQGKAVKAVFDISAKTHRGVLAKLKIVELAYGSGNEVGDGDLESWQDLDAPWLENVIEDFERLAGRAI